MDKLASQPCPFCEEPHSALDHARELLAKNGEAATPAAVLEQARRSQIIFGVDDAGLESETRVRVDGARAQEDRREALERGRTVARILARCLAELVLLERIAHLNADEVNGLSAAKGYVERAELALERGLGL